MMMIMLMMTKIAFLNFILFVATIVQSSLQVASIILRQATESASRVLIETAQLSRTIYDITLKYNQIVYNVGNASLLVANASASGISTNSKAMLPNKYF